MGKIVVSTQKLEIETALSPEEIRDILKDLSNQKQGCLNTRRIVSLVKVETFERKLSFEIIADSPNRRFWRGYRYIQTAKAQGVIEFDSATKARINLIFQMGGKTICLQVLMILIFDLSIFLYIYFLSWNQLAIVLFLLAFVYSLIGVFAICSMYRDKEYLKAIISDALVKLGS